MIFEYMCPKCQIVLERNAPIGKAPETVTCPDCNVLCERFYGSMNFILKGPAGSWPGKKLSFNKEMTERNERAGRKMRKTWEGTQPKLIDQR